MYFLVKDGKILQSINALTGNEAMYRAKSLGGIACLIVSGHTISEVVQHLGPLSEPSHGHVETGEPNHVDEENSIINHHPTHDKFDDCA